MTKKPNDNGPTEAQLEEMFRGMLKRDMARLEAELAGNPRPGDAKRYRSTIGYIMEVLALPSGDFLDLVSREVCTAKPGSFWDVRPTWSH